MKNTQKKNCEDWLEQRLKDKPEHNAGVRRAAKAAGYTRGQLQEAKNALGVKATHRSDRDQLTSAIFWYLPNERPDDHDA